MPQLVFCVLQEERTGVKVCALLELASLRVGNVSPGVQQDKRPRVMYSYLQRQGELQVSNDPKHISQVVVPRHSAF